MAWCSGLELDGRDGGVCAVNQWSSQGLMARDRIHMTVAGYRRSADLFANWLQLRVRNAGG